MFNLSIKNLKSEKREESYFFALKGHVSFNVLDLGEFRTRVIDFFSPFTNINLINFFRYISFKHILLKKNNKKETFN